MKTTLSQEQISLFVEEILEDYNKRKSTPHSDAHHKKTNHFFDAIVSCYQKHRGSLGKMTIKQFDTLIIPACHECQPPGKKKLEEIAAREKKEATDSATHFMQVNCEIQCPYEEEQSFLEELIGSVGASLVRKFV